MSQTDPHNDHQQPDIDQVSEQHGESTTSVPRSRWQTNSTSTRYGRERKLARATLRNIKQNLFFAFAYNAIGVPIAAGLLYPLTGLLLSPMIAAAAMSLSSV